MVYNGPDNLCSELLVIILPVHDEGSYNKVFFVNDRRWRKIIICGVELGSVIIEIVTGFQDRSDIIINLPTKRLSTNIRINCSSRANR
jgi:hypothetical protein